MIANMSGYLAIRRDDTVEIWFTTSPLSAAPPEGEVVGCWGEVYSHLVCSPENEVSKFLMFCELVENKRKRRLDQWVQIGVYHLADLDYIVVVHDDETKYTTALRTSEFYPVLPRGLRLLASRRRDGASYPQPTRSMIRSVTKENRARSGFSKERVYKLILDYYQQHHLEEDRLAQRCHLKILEEDVDKLIS